MPLGYGYGNARLRAMRSRLLTVADYNDLLAKRRIEDVIARLRETPYKEDIEVALIHAAGVRCIFEALSANLARTLRQMRTFFEGEPRRLIEILLRRWDRHNLLTLLRGIRQAVPPEMMLSALVPVGQLDEVALRELARQPDLRAMLDLMVAWHLPYAHALREVRGYGGMPPELDQLELALNRFHYAAIYEALGTGNGNRTLVLEQFQTEADLTNLSVALRLAQRPELVPVIRQRLHAADVRPLLIEPAGHLSAARLAELVAAGGGVEGIVAGLSATRYGPALEAGYRRYRAGEGGLAALERELERWQAGRSAALFHGDPLGIGIAIGYMDCKEVEVANLRLIAQAVFLDMPREPVQRDLIMV
ncbi:MAG: V-type ATPase subunit [Anaerolineae bacterium]|nr:V-type ATPase subunit [Anaerolineae bacterium]